MSLKRSDNPLDTISIEQPPAGQTSNFVDPSTLGPELIAVEAVFTSLMLLIVSLRVLVRLKWTKGWSLSDYICIIAALGSVAHTVMIVESTKYGFGRHMWDVPVSWVLVDKNVRVMSSTAIIFPFTVFFAKVSILLIYLRLFKIDRPLRISIHVGLILMALFHAAIIGVGIGTVIKCVGVSASTSTFCNAASGSIQLAQSAFNVVTDFWILILPMPLVRKLQLPRSRKIGLFFVFGAGVLACGASLLRLVEFSIRYNSTDTFWDHAIDTEVSAIEMNIAIMVSCASSLPQFLVKTRLYLHSTTSSLRKRMLSWVGTRSISKKQSIERDDFYSDISLDSYCVLETQGEQRSAENGSRQDLRRGAAESV